MSWSAESKQAPLTADAEERDLDFLQSPASLLAQPGGEMSDLCVTEAARGCVCVFVRGPACDRGPQRSCVRGACDLCLLAVTRSSQTSLCCQMTSCGSSSPDGCRHPSLEEEAACRGKDRLYTGLGAPRE